MATVLFVTGLSAGDNLGATSRGILDLFKAAGHTALSIDIAAPGSVVDLQDMIERTPVDFAVGICGFGNDAFHVDDGETKNIWKSYQIPFLTLHGDSPAYLFDRHVNLTPWHGTMYGFGDHYDLRLRLPKKEGIFGIMPPIVFDQEPLEKMDFTAKRNGKIIFPKNGGNPAELSEVWRRLLPKNVSNNLFELADILVANITDEASCDIDALVVDMFHAKGMTIEHAAKTRLFYVAQLDDYLRRVKCVMLAEVLKRFPVEIHGKGWDFIDFTNAKCTVVNQCDYKETRAHIKSSLAVLDFTPNTAKGFHDRFMRAVGMHTACLTNVQSSVTQIYGKDYGLAYEFNMDAIGNLLTVMHENPADVVDAGKQAAQRFMDVFTTESSLQSYFDAAEAVRLSAISGIDALTNIQPYFIPSKTLAN